jgi:hypothetical protein
MLVATNYGARGVGHVDLSTGVALVLVDNVDNLVLGGLVDNVDNLFLSCPTCPQRKEFFGERKRQGRKVWTSWTMWTTPFKSLPYNIAPREYTKNNT